MTAVCWGLSLDPDSVNSIVDRTPHKLKVKSKKRLGEMLFCTVFTHTYMFLLLKCLPVICACKCLMKYLIKIIAVHLLVCLVCIMNLHCHDNHAFLGQFGVLWIVWCLQHGRCFGCIWITRLIWLKSVFSTLMWHWSDVFRAVWSQKSVIFKSDLNLFHIWSLTGYIFNSLPVVVKT